jgi:hypothetical protein
MPDIPGYRLEGPSSRQSSDSSVRYDYSGLDRHLKQQDELAQLRNSKYQQLYGGDVAGSVASTQRIRDLLAQLIANASDTTEQDPFQIPNQLRRIESQSSGNSSGYESGSEQYGDADSQQTQLARNILNTKKS